MSLSILLSTFANNILPIMLLAGAGYVLGRLLHIDSQSLGRVVFYVFMPALVFSLLMHSELRLREAVLVVSFVTTFILTMGAITFLSARLFRLERPLLTAVLVTTMFGNTGNYGLPLVSFAFGEGALRYASLYFVTTTVLFNSLGVLIASLGHMNLREALLGLFKVPMIHAVILAVLVDAFRWQIPNPIDRAVEIAAGGSIPLMLILLGLELTRVQWSSSLRPVAISVGLRLLIAPFVASFLAMPFALPPVLREASLLESSMPAAVNNTILAKEYRLDSALVTAIVFAGTLISPLTLTPLIVFLGR